MYACIYIYVDVYMYLSLYIYIGIIYIYIYIHVEREKQHQLRSSEVMYVCERDGLSHTAILTCRSLRAKKSVCRVDTLPLHRHHHGVWSVKVLRYVDAALSIQMFNFEKCGGSLLQLLNIAQTKKIGSQLDGND